MRVINTVFVRQKYEGIYVDYNSIYPDHYYPLPGTTESVILKGNSSWKARLLPGGTAVKRLINAEGDNQSEIEHLYFEMHTGANTADGIYGRSVDIGSNDGFMNRDGARTACEQLGNDWYLPDIADLSAMYKLMGSNDELKAIHGFESAEYWSSSISGSGGYTLNFQYGTQITKLSSSIEEARARCIRRR